MRTRSPLACGQALAGLSAARADTIDKVNPRELEMGAMAMAVLAWLISEEGL